MRTYTIVVEPEDTDGFTISVPALPGCLTQGRPLDECWKRAAEAIAVHIAGLQASGEPIPRRGRLIPAADVHRRRLTAARRPIPPTAPGTCLWDGAGDLEAIAADLRHLGVVGGLTGLGTDADPPNPRPRVANRTSRDRRQLDAQETRHHR